jgi:hypothetical protein
MHEENITGAWREHYFFEIFSSKAKGRSDCGLLAEAIFGT